MKQRKILFVLALLCLQAWQGVCAHDIEVANADGVTIYYVWTNNQTELAVSYRGSYSYSYSNEYSGAVNIPESVTYNGKTYPVTSIGEYAFRGCSGLTSVTIGNGVTSIGRGAFYGCSGLQEVNFNATNCTSMGGPTTDPVFSGCTALTTLRIGDNVQRIPSYAFYQCSGLTSVTIPGSVTSIGKYAFSGCVGLKKITIDDGIKSIGDYAFSKNEKITDVYCYAVRYPITSSNAFESSYPDYITLHVPEESVGQYRAVEPWSKFKAVVPLTGGDNPSGQNYVLSIMLAEQGSVSFQVSEGSTYSFTISSESGWRIHSVTFNNVNVTNQIGSNGVFTTPAIYNNSTLRVTYEKNTSSAVEMVSNPDVQILGTSQGIQVANASTSDIILVYNPDGVLQKTVKAESHTTDIPLAKNQLYIVKIGEKTVKVRL